MTATEARRRPIHVEQLPVMTGRYSLGTLGDKIGAIVLAPRAPLGWYVGTAITGSLVLVLLAAVTWLFIVGIGIWGVNVPIAWGMAIGNFVWWIGIGHAGTLISAILLLLRQQWRTSINRFAEAMTLFAVACALLFPLVWDVFAVTTYALVSLLFWFVGLVPDMATLRDRTTNRFGRFVYGILAM